ncbi:MAG: hypothetical protein RSD57_14580 [Comamonas sp.]
MKSFEAIARSAYAVFCNSLHGTQAKLPAWNELPQQTRNAWIESARHVAVEIQQVH